MNTFALASFTERTFWTAHFQESHTWSLNRREGREREGVDRSPSADAIYGPANIRPSCPTFNWGLRVCYYISSLKRSNDCQDNFRSSCLLVSRHTLSAYTLDSHSRKYRVANWNTQAEKSWTVLEHKKELGHYSQDHKKRSREVCNKDKLCHVTDIEVTLNSG